MCALPEAGIAHAVGALHQIKLAEACSGAVQSNVTVVICITLSSSTVIVPLLSVSMVLKSWRRPLISSDDKQRATIKNAAFFSLVMPANCSHTQLISAHVSGQCTPQVLTY